MSNLFSKHLHLCFFKLKYPTCNTATPLSPPHPEHHRCHPPPSSSSSNSTTFLFNTTFSLNSDSLYEPTSSSAHSTSKSTDDFFSSSSSHSSSSDPPPPDFASVFASQRFFFSSPGRSNSILQSPDTRRPTNSNNTTTTTTTLMSSGGGVRVPKYSLNPYVDFRRSMEEMIESRKLVDVRKDWDYLHELLLSYLSLNPTHTHKYIVRAFTDLVVDLLSVPETSHCRKPKSRRRQRSSFSGRLV